MRFPALPAFGVSLLLASLLTSEVGASQIPAAQSAGHKTTTQAKAPADEYFGHYHISVLGMRNALHDYQIRISNNRTAGKPFLSSIALVEESMRDWSSKFPKDPSVPIYFLSLERLYLGIDGDDASEHAKDTVTWLDTLLPNTEGARVAHALLDQGTLVADDGTPVTDQTPAILGVVPGLLPDESPASAVTAQR